MRSQEIMCKGPLSGAGYKDSTLEIKLQFCRELHFQFFNTLFAPVMSLCGRYEMRFRFTRWGRTVVHREETTISADSPLEITYERRSRGHRRGRALTAKAFVYCKNRWARSGHECQLFPCKKRRPDRRIKAQGELGSSTRPSN